MSPLQAAIEPFPGYNIHLVNEAYGNPGGWLQASLYRCVRALNTKHKSMKAGGCMIVGDSTVLWCPELSPQRTQRAARCLRLTSRFCIWLVVRRRVSSSLSVDACCSRGVLSDHVICMRSESVGRTNPCFGVYRTS